MTTNREVFSSVQHVNSELFDITRNTLEDYQLTYTDDKSSRKVSRLTEEDYIIEARSKLATLIADETVLSKFLQSHRSDAARTPKLLDEFIRARSKEGVGFKERKQVRSTVSREWCVSRDGSARKCVSKNLRNVVADTTHARVPIGGLSGVQNTIPLPAVAGLAIHRREDFEQVSVIERAYTRPAQAGGDCKSPGQRCGYDYVNSLAYLPMWYTEDGFCHEPWLDNHLGVCYQIASDQAGKNSLHVYFAELNTGSTFNESFGKMSGASFPGLAEYGVSHWVGDILSMRLDDESSTMPIGEVVSNFRLLAVTYRFKFYKALGANLVAVDGDAMTIMAHVYATMAMRGGLLDPNITVRAETYSHDERIPITTVQNYVVWVCAAIMGLASSYLALDKLVAKLVADVVWDSEAVNTSSRGSWLKCVFSLRVGDDFDYAVRKFNDDQYGTGFCHNPKETSLRLGLDSNGGQIRHLGFSEGREKDSDVPAFRTHQLLKGKPPIRDASPGVDGDLDAGLNSVFTVDRGADVTVYRLESRFLKRTTRARESLVYGRRCRSPLRHKCSS
ncbi:unnamed protein product [Chondrus crispus]|uniref:Uncharacterized protein n=1 Tax=Chondrus crispus TaxID=2769 RepID=R7QCP3_CHOCR|nr:unnamed protein product [Chondrus crispus]CDF35201.1 unnamed protein product [Chondrus crispus]|eukprot:XP_005715020.1 unnamed protein product [Chondrus crispus]